MEKAAKERVVASPPSTFTLRGYQPPVVLAVIGVALVLFVGINTEPMPLTWGSYARWGGPNVQAVWDGAYWGLLTSNFLHVAGWHLAFNVWWLWILGRKIEYEQGSGFMLALVLTATWVGAAAELAIGEQGIGLSGVGYACFGYIWWRARSDARYQHFLRPQTVRLFWGWLVLCLVLTEANLWQVGNAAHAAGLAWGVAVAGLAPGRLALRYGGLAALLALACVPLRWVPWSVAWLSHEAYAAQVAQRLPEARRYYQRILHLDAHNEFARTNLRGLEVYELSTRTTRAFERGQWQQGEALRRQVLRLEPGSAWAKAWAGADTTQRQP